MSSTRSLTRRIALAAVAAVGAVVLAACGSDSGGSAHDGMDMDKASPSVSAEAESGKHNNADVTFAQEMIPHHRQAVDMADLAATRASSSEVKALAEKIKGAQDPEIKTMSGWLTTWGEDVPEEMSEDMPGMDHSGDAGMPGMMDAAEMETLEKASGKAFDTAFLEMMIKHHEGAVEMSDTEKAEGAYGPAKEMASEIATSQTKEIADMKKLLGRG